YRLSDIASALGESQMKKLNYFLDQRRKIAGYYRESLNDFKAVKLPPDHPGHAYHLFPIWVDPEIRRRVFEFLRSSGIGVQVHYIPLHFHSYYSEKFGYKRGDFPNAERFSAGEISLPIFPSMSERDVDYVVDKLQEAVKFQ
ncbi:DegT/DnrJ/EryC1/StrS family aminotransferase, partial [Synergistaceae bacterium OttesenSCG-928-I11]|nr:DegT/DnrJ/EryC1/StrS family aminotransferase [Synergistaceae bacterium OttesenSCG-928-I11]